MSTNGTGKPGSKRFVETQYMYRGEIVKLTHSTHPNRANRNAFDHLQTNDYGASVAQVIDTETGQLYAEFTRSISGRVAATFKHDPREFVTQSALDRFRKMGRA